MAIINKAKREINAKIVYYGTAGSGKSTSMRYLYERLKPSLRGEFKTMTTAGNLLQFFDFTPFETPLFGGFRVRFHVYTLSGEVTNPAAWKMTLKGADGVILTASDAVHQLMPEQESIARLRNFIGGYGLSLNDMPVVLQISQHENGYAADELCQSLGMGGIPVCPAKPSVGEGVLEALARISPAIMARISADPSLSEGLPLPGDAPVSAAPEIAAAIPQPQEAELALPVAAEMVAIEQPQPVQVFAREEQRGDGAAVVPLVTMGEPQVDSDGRLRLPLQIAAGGAVRRLMLSISLVEE